MKTTSGTLPSPCLSSAGVSSELDVPTTVLACPHNSLPEPEVLAAAPLPPIQGTEKFMRRLQKDKPSRPARLQHRGQPPDSAMDVAMQRLAVVED